MTDSALKPDLNRRRFLKGAAIASAAVAAPLSQDAGSALAQGAAPKAMPPSARDLFQETAVPGALAKAEGRPGGDFMVDVLRALGIEYVATNPASSCRGLHESINNYAMNKNPELLTVTHEEIGAGMAHGYAKVTGKPMGLLFHGTVGMQHATMAIYNAWCDRVPMFVMAGNHMDAADRLPGVPTTHAAQDPMSLVRDFTKWDDQPLSLQHFAESAVRAYRISMTPPMEPVALSIDGHLQEHPIPEGAKLRIPKLSLVTPPAGDPSAVREAAQMLVSAQNPFIIVDRATRTDKGQGLLVELAELLNAGVIDQYGRQNFPNRHFLNASDRGRGGVSQADVVMGLGLTDFWGTVNSFADNPEQLQSSRIKDGTKLISINPMDLYIRANYQDFQRFQQVDLAIGADVEATLPLLIEAVKVAMTPSLKDAIAKRAETHRKAYGQGRERLMSAAAVAWDASPISTARLSAEVWAAIKDQDWALVSNDSSLSNWPHRIWDFTKPYQFIGGSGGAGIGYGLPAALGASLAHRAHGRLAVNIQNDGDAMFTLGALWTAVHHKIPMLTIMHNNRAYHQEVMHVQRVSNWRDRGVDRQWLGTTIRDPNVDFATLAKSMGMEGIGPITNPDDLGPALKRAVAMVKAGEPVLIDAITQPR
ncbi:MAG: thiamine pyrophosphate binding protein [Hyphomicrobiales bacterium]|nr:thiamine pyrophosphate binding protein [Hyphomicrobiales bacterium]